MGFGIFVIGYAITFGSAFFTTYMFLDIVGCIIMAASLFMLSAYQKTFRLSSAASVVLCMVYAASAVMRMMGYGTPATGEEVLLGEKIYFYLSSYAVPLASLVFHALFLVAVSRLATDVELPMISSRCRFYMFVLVCYFAVYFAYSTFRDQIAASSVKIHNILASGLNLFHGIWLIMMLFMILSCLKWIAPAEVVEAEERGDSSADGLLARVGAKLDKIQKSARTPREEKEAEKLRRELEEENLAADSGSEESAKDDTQN